MRDEIPAELLEPTPISTRRPETYRELAILATEHLNSARQANADKAAIAEILGARGPLRTY
ncbi:Rz1-like lysis system protein LysC [Sulfitobacter pontiacus]|uniref:Rz1-like lysis system protein LysC n=1 Tax=Sulfitobacter pontiacus TaxID=60137 RepID=UPI003B8A9870